MIVFRLPPRHFHHQQKLDDVHAVVVVVVVVLVDTCTSHGSHLESISPTIKKEKNKERCRGYPTLLSHSLMEQTNRQEVNADFKNSKN